MVRPRVFFDINHGTEPMGRIVVELYQDQAPKTCEKCVAQQWSSISLPSKILCSHLLSPSFTGLCLLLSQSPFLLPSKLDSEYISLINFQLPLPRHHPSLTDPFLPPNPLSPYNRRFHDSRRGHDTRGRDGRAIHLRERVRG